MNHEVYIKNVSYIHVHIHSVCGHFNIKLLDYVHHAGMVSLATMKKQTAAYYSACYPYNKQ